MSPVKFSIDLGRNLIRYYILKLSEKCTENNTFANNLVLPSNAVRLRSVSGIDAGCLLLCVNVTYMLEAVYKVLCAF